MSGCEVGFWEVGVEVGGDPKTQEGAQCRGRGGGWGGSRARPTSFFGFVNVCDVFLCL